VTDGRDHVTDGHGHATDAQETEGLSHVIERRNPDAHVAHPARGGPRVTGRAGHDLARGPAIDV